MIAWDTYSRAALDYSRLRPRRLTTAVTPTIGERRIALPSDALAVLTVVNGGDEIDLLEALTDETGTAGWACTDTELVVTPAPTTADPITIIYEARHLPDELAQTFPTIPAAHLPLVDDLEQALVLDAEADTIAQGPMRYVFGQTDISREKAPAELRARAAALRQRVRDLLDEPVAFWR